MTRRDIYRQVARLHAACINEGFMRQLGERFLALLYEAIDEADGAVLLIESEGATVVGFVSGALRMRPIYLRLLRKFPRLAWALLPTVVRPARVKRILEILRYDGGGDHADDVPHAELLSIAVAASHRGQRRADELYRRLGRRFALLGETEFAITVGASLLPAQRFYARMGAQPFGEAQVHGSQRSLVYRQRIDDITPA